MIVFPVLIPGQNFFSREREGKLQNATGRDGKFEACTPGNHGKREFPLTPGFNSALERSLKLNTYV